ncbi:acetyl-CoA carboxylase carboxyl transferase subunit alpha [Actinoallomurus sp. NPDC052308]|uniref:acetyl-CoA carboxylase carboxyl transferase subunit alpha n=1 Tax=Actinoallomurus sp. NPDC052308 TaxID=3155530 RepID=UPI0034316BE0
MRTADPERTARAQVPEAQPPAAPRWLLCEGCNRPVYERRFSRDLRVCPECGRYARLSAEERIEQLFDAGSISTVAVAETIEDPLLFTDSRPYVERLRTARRQTGLDDAVVCVRGEIGGHPLVAAVMDFNFLGGSLGCAAGERIAAAAEAALLDGVPFLVVTASGGARMQEGALSLMQLAKTTQALVALHRAGILTISVITDPTYGGVAASFATQTDVILAERGARLGFAGPRVIMQTIRQQLPAGFQTAEFLFEHGLIDEVVPRPALRPTLARLLAAAAPATPVDDPLRAVPSGVVRQLDDVPERDPWDVMRLAREIGRPTTLDYAGRLLDGFVELHGDRLSDDCTAIVGGIGRFAGRPVMLIGHQKGHTAQELRERNYGMSTPAGYRKAGRLMQLAARLGLPIITLVDTQGAYPGLEAEREGQAWAIAENLRLMAHLPVPIVAVVTGEGGSGGALALALADRVLVLENSVYSVISPEACGAILWNDASTAPQAARALRIEPRELLRHRIADGVIPEPEGGAHNDHAAAADLLRRALCDVLAEIVDLDGERLVAERAERFGAFGTRPPVAAHKGGQD